MLHDLIEKLSDFPGFFLFCRGILEANFVAIKRTIRELMPPEAGRRVLDLGCGPGVLAPLFAPADYVGVDINGGYVRYARARHRGGFFDVMDARRLGFADASFDDALVFGLLHHLGPDESGLVIAELRRVVKPDGRVLIIEDIPTRSRLNVVGRLIHNIENGHHIRAPEQYRSQLERHFRIRAEKVFLSGVCDYYAASLSSAARPAAVAR